MSPRRRRPGKTDTEEEFFLRLYIVEGTPLSIRAVANLETLCCRYLAGRYRLEIIDVMEEPRRILSDRILATPTLLKLSPDPQVRIIGDLSEEARVLAALGITWVGRQQ